MNLLAVGSLACAVLAVAAMVGFGAGELAVFGVGTGHIALCQIRSRRQRGAVLAYVSLALCYLVGVWALASTATYTARLLTT